MTNEEKMQTFESGYREGFYFAAQALASRFIRIIYAHPSWMLEPDRRKAIAETRLTTKSLLEKRGIIPSTYAVMRGEAEEVPVDFNMQY